MYTNAHEIPQATSRGFTYSLSMPTIKLRFGKTFNDMLFLRTTQWFIPCAIQKIRITIILTVLLSFSPVV